MNSEKINRISLSTGLDANLLRAEFKVNNRIHIPGVLESISADYLHTCLAKQKKWNLVYNQSGKHVDLDSNAVLDWSLEDQQKLKTFIFSQATSNFQYTYEAIPIYDLYHKNLLEVHFLKVVYDFLNSESFINFIKNVTCDDSITFADAQATRFQSGHFLTQHDDNVAGKNRRIAYVLNLTRGWQSDWGGALQFFSDNGNIDGAYLPCFNALNLFAVPCKHSVGFVTPFANRPRLSITGWLRSGVDPMVR